ncbi:hypothetical protein TNCV_201211 [Trichonephila clavipes]|nr:hypothetical protein TNCV_201211 [Trichonephila clavipes]
MEVSGSAFISPTPLGRQDGEAPLLRSSTSAARAKAIQFPGFGTRKLCVRRLIAFALMGFDWIFFLLRIKKKSSDCHNCCPKDAHGIHHGKGLDVRLSLAVALSTMQVKGWFSSVHSNFKGEHPRGGQGPPTSLTIELEARHLCREPPCRKDPFYIQTPMTSPEFEPRPYDTTVNVDNHFTGWATI